MTIDAKEKRALRARAHHLRPVVSVGAAGVTAAVLAEVGLALDHHELIKVRLASTERGERTEETRRICDELGADHVQSIGRIAVSTLR